jgi:hypothetical protein
LVEEALAPEADDIATNGERGGDFIIRVALGGQEDHVRPDDLKIRQRIFARTTFQDLSFVSREGDDVGAASRQILVLLELQGKPRWLE